MTYQYSYLIGDLVLLVFWSILFYLRKDVRKEMLAISLIFGIIGIFTGFIYFLDWWHPQTITNTTISLEDFLFGFVIAGIASVIYITIFRKRLKFKKLNQKLKSNKILLLVILFAIIFFVSLYILKLNTFYSAIISFLILIFFIWFKRKDLILNSLISGILLVIISVPAYLIPEFITPGWIQASWYFENLSGITFFKVPIEDFIWIFLTGAFIGPLYEFYKEAKVVSLTKKG